MPDYKNGKIYTIRCKTDASLIYVGSTTEKLSIRMSKHRYDSKKPQKLHFYKQVQNWNDWYIELYEDFPCERKEQLEKREGEIIREIGNLNKIIPGSSREDNGENKEYSKQYYEQNKEKIQEYFKEYSKQNKEKIQEYYKGYSKQYYEQNKEKIEEKYKINVVCDCGCTIQKGCLSKHLKSKKHAKILNSISNE